MWDPICFDLPEWKSSLVTCVKTLAGFTFHHCIVHGMASSCNMPTHIFTFHPHTSPCTIFHPHLRRNVVLTFSLFQMITFHPLHFSTLAKHGLTRHDADVWTGKEIGRHYSKCSPVTLIRHKLRPHSTSFCCQKLPKIWARKLENWFGTFMLKDRNWVVENWKLWDFIASLCT